MTPVTDPELLAKLGAAEAPKAVSDPALLAQLNGNSSGVMDFVKSIPRGVLSGVSGALSAGGQAAAHEMSQPDLAESIPSQPQTTDILEKNVTGELHQPEGRAGRFGAAIGESLGNPVSYVGPGSAALRVAGAILSAAGGEAGGQAAEGTKYEGAARVAGALLGGGAAVKAVGPSIERAAVPSAAELKAAADKGYSAARNSGLELHPQATADFASKVQQDLTNGPKYSFTGGSNGTAPKTFALLDDLQAAPDGAFVTGANLDTIRIRLGDIAKETRDFKPTPDAKAAMVAKRHFDSFLENPPENHILAGDAEDYVRATQQANGNYAAAQRLGDFDARLTKAQNATDRQIAGSLDAQIKSKAGAMLDNPKKLRGLNDTEKDQLQLINSGGPVSNTLRQLGRGGAGVIPMMAHVMTGIATGGASVPLSFGLGSSLYAARKVSEAITKSRASNLVDMLAKRSPEYERRAAAITPTDLTANKAAIVRALLAR